MKVLLQRVKGAQVEVESKILGRIQKGLLLYVGIAPGDTPAQADWLAAKVATLRVFQDPKGKLNLDAAQVDGAVLAVPNFTVMGDARRGRRPSFTGAASPGQARGVFDYFVNRLAQSGLRVQTGCFGAHMHILSVADGPVNVIIDSPPPPGEAPAIQPPADNGQAPAPGPTQRARSTGAEPLAQPPGAAGDSTPGGESQTS
jgi:D-tyrosyl-tRNA(Tyr) deacylase